MVMRRTVWTTALVLSLGCSSAPNRLPQRPSPEEARGLAEARAELIAAATSSDAARLAAVYTLDAVLMNPNVPDVRGRADIEGHFRRAFAAIAIRKMTLTPVEVTICDGRAYDLSAFTQLIGGAGQAPAEDRGRVMLVWAREPGGRWRIARALVNSSVAQSPLH